MAPRICRPCPAYLYLHRNPEAGVRCLSVPGNIFHPCLGTRRCAAVYGQSGPGPALCRGHETPGRRAPPGGRRTNLRAWEAVPPVRETWLLMLCAALYRLWRKGRFSLAPGIPNSPSLSPTPERKPVRDECQSHMLTLMGRRRQSRLHKLQSSMRTMSFAEFPRRRDVFVIYGPS